MKHEMNYGNDYGNEYDIMWTEIHHKYLHNIYLKDYDKNNENIFI